MTRSRTIAGALATELGFLPAKCDPAEPACGSPAAVGRRFVSQLAATSSFPSPAATDRTGECDARHLRVPPQPPSRFVLLIRHGRELLQRCDQVRVQVHVLTNLGLIPRHFRVISGLPAICILVLLKRNDDRSGQQDHQKANDNQHPPNAVPYLEGRRGRRCRGLRGTARSRPVILVSRRFSVRS